MCCTYAWNLFGLILLSEKIARKIFPRDRKFEALSTVQRMYTYHPVAMLFGEGTVILYVATLNMGLEAS